MSTLEDERFYEKYEISIAGMTCSNCSNYLESSLKNVQQIKTANVNLILENTLIVVEYYNYNQIILTNEKINKEKLKDNATFLQMIIENFGFQVINVNKIDEKENKGKRILNLVFEKINIISSIQNENWHAEIKVLFIFLVFRILL